MSRMMNLYISCIALFFIGFILYSSDGAGRAVMYFVKKNDLKATLLLMESGIDPDAGLTDKGSRTLTGLSDDYLGKPGQAEDMARAVKGTPLMEAARAGDFGVALVLIRKGADINFSTELGVTPLMFAATGGNAEMCRLLLDRGAKIDSRDRFSETALFYAVSTGHTEAAQLLLEKGADPDAENSLGQTPLSVASSRGMKGMVFVLVSAGADPDCRVNPAGVTVLMNEIRQEHKDNAWLMIRKGADPLIRDSNSRNAFDYARETGNSDIIGILGQEPGT